MKPIDQNLIRYKVNGPLNQVDGAYQLPHPKIKDYTIQVIASSGLGWEHVSITLRDNKKGKFVERTPTWQEMCYLKDMFWSDDETVVQYHPPKSDYVNNHPYCLHLWRPTDIELPRPHKSLVGI